MSAPAFAIPAAPFMGPAAAPKRGAATTDADFAAVLDEADPAEAPAKPAAPVATKKNAETAPVDETTLEVGAEAAPASDAGVIPVPTPMVTPAPTLVAEAEIVVAETVPLAPAAATAAAETTPVWTDDLAPANDTAPTAEPGLATAPTIEEAAPPAEPKLPAAKDNAASPAPTMSPAAAEAPAPADARKGVDLPDLNTLLPEQSKSAPTPQTVATVASTAAAALAATVAAPAPRPAKSPVETIAPVEAASSEETPAAAETPPPETSAAPAAPAEAPRTRDVIDRVLTGRTDAQPSPKDAATAVAAPQSDGFEPTPQAASPSPQPVTARPAVAEPAVLTLQAADAPVVTAPGAATGQPVEARAAEPAVSLALSTVSHASIETTAQIAAQIVKKLEGRSVRFEMALTPEGLGNVDVSLDIDADGKLIAKMAFDNPLAATELRGRVDELRRQLQDSGFTVADDALTFAERDASAGQHGGSAFDNRPDPRSARAFGAGARLSAEADIAVPSRWIPLTLTPDRVDMKV